MKGWISAAVVAGVVALAAPALALTAAAAQQQVVKQTADAGRATDFSAQRYYRRYHGYGYRPYYRPYPYYARPYYYRPYPYYAPAPFLFGFGFGPFLW